MGEGRFDSTRVSSLLFGAFNLRAASHLELAVEELALEDLVLADVGADDLGDLLRGEERAQAALGGADV